MLADPIAADPDEWSTDKAARFYGLKSLRTAPYNAAAAFSRLWASPSGVVQSHAVLPGISETAYAPSLPGEPNATYAADWLFLTVERDALTNSPLLRVTVVSADSVFASIAKHFPTQRVATLHKPDWLRLEGIGTVYNLADPAFLVKTEGQNAIIGLPVAVADDSRPPAAVYISLDGATHVDVLNTDRLDRGR
jgi:hypothetical protein